VVDDVTIYIKRTDMEMAYLEKYFKFSISWWAIAELFLRGLYHRPVNFKEINGPKKPILFHDLFFTADYGRV
jgi:hypothetical protein